LEVDIAANELVCGCIFARYDIDSGAFPEQLAVTDFDYFPDLAYGLFQLHLFAIQDCIFTNDVLRHHACAIPSRHHYSGCNRNF
jgi:hypothetical protein